jgi:sarcosine oxidase subunit alpha
MAARSFAITINGVAAQVRAGVSVAAAIIQAGAISRRSLHGEPRQPLCGMGICFECRAQVDGQLHEKTCQLACRPGMRIETE